MVAACVVMLCQVAAASVPKDSASTEKIIYIDRIEIVGNQSLKTSEIIAEMQTRQNNIYFGFFRPWVGVYQFGKIFPDSSGIRQFIQNTLGEAPQVFDPALLKQDIELLQELYAANGYPSAQFNPELTFSHDSALVSIKLKITEGNPIRIESLSYIGLERLDSAVVKEMRRDAAVAVGDVYRLKDMIAERLRLLNFLQDKGYAFLTPDSIRAEVRLSRTNQNASIRFFIRLSERLDFGDITAIVHNPTAPDTASERYEETENGVTVRLYGERKVSPYLIRRSIAYKRGDQSSNFLKRETVQRLGSVGIFEVVNILDDSARAGNLYTTIELRLLPQFQIKPELKLDNRNNAPNVSLGVGYLNRNLLGGAESFNVSGSGGLQLTFNTGATEFQGGQLDPFIYNFEGRIEYGVPYFFSPRNRFVALAQYSILNQPPIRRQSLLFRLRSLIFPNEFQQITLDMLEIESVQNATPALDSLQRALLIERGILPMFQPQNISNRLDFFFSNLTEANRTLDVRFNAGVEVAGALPFLLNALFEPQNPEPIIFGLRYNQFLRFNTQIAVGIPTAGNSTFAWKIFAGYLVPYLRSSNTPLERRFNAGGPNSLRGWGFNLLGPGNTLDTNAAISRLGSDVKLEVSIEERFNFFRFFGYPSGMVIFMDAGNIWTRSGENALALPTLLSETAWNAGFGIRLGTPIGPLRLDLAYRVYDPSQPVDARWAIRRWQLFSPQINFGIGEAF